MIGTITYAGYLFGSILSGPYGDIHGRRIPMMWAALSASIFCFLSAFSFNFYFYLIMRFKYFNI
jgi:MFS family permease